MKRRSTIVSWLVIGILAAALLIGLVTGRFETEDAKGGDDTVKSYADYMEIDWTENFVDLTTGIRMCYCTCGPEDGVPLILIHGVTDSRISWSQAAPMFAEKGYRVYVPECRGHGKTDKPDPGPEGYRIEMHRDDILAFMDALDIEKAHIVGHSQGSLICQLINLKAPERVLSTTLIDTTTDNTKNEFLEWVYYGDGETYLGVHGYDEEQKMPDEFLDSWLGSTNESEAFCAATRAHAYQLPYEAWGWLIEGVRAFDNSEGIHDITGDVLVIWGTEDAIFTEEDFNAVRDGLTGCDARFEVIEGASHCPHWDSLASCREVVDIIDDFIKETGKS